MTAAEIHQLTQNRSLVPRRDRGNRRGRSRASPQHRSIRSPCAPPKRWDSPIGGWRTLKDVSESAIAHRRREFGIAPVFKTVDTCGAEFQAFTPYLYSTYEGEDEAPPTARRKIMILGGGPNRIGQGIEFDYCCVHASLALKDDGFETIMVNCNPETVSTDYDISDRLYFEPLTFEDVMAIAERESPTA